MCGIRARASSTEKNARADRRWGSGSANTIRPRRCPPEMARGPGHRNGHDAISVNTRFSKILVTGVNSKIPRQRFSRQPCGFEAMVTAASGEAPRRAKLVTRGLDHASRIYPTCALE